MTGTREAQGTVAHFDPVHGSGLILFDDGGQLPFDRAALDGSQVRNLRLGQRMRLVLQDDAPGGAPVIVRMTIITLPLPA